MPQQAQQDDWIPLNPNNKPSTSTKTSDIPVSTNATIVRGTEKKYVPPPSPLPGFRQSISALPELAKDFYHIAMTPDPSVQTSTGGLEALIPGMPGQSMAEGAAQLLTDSPIVKSIKSLAEGVQSLMDAFKGGKTAESVAQGALPSGGAAPKQISAGSPEPPPVDVTPLSTKTSTGPSGPARPMSAHISGELPAGSQKQLTAGKPAIASPAAPPAPTATGPAEGSVGVLKPREVVFRGKNGRFGIQYLGEGDPVTANELIQHKQSMEPEAPKAKPKKGKP